MGTKNWPLSKQYKIQYFANDELEKVLKRIRNFVKNNLITVHDLSFNSEYVVDEVSIHYSATVIYTGIVTEDTNVEA